MNLVTGIVVYVIVWWIVLFAVLPWGAHPPETPETGMAPGAPARPRILLKCMVTTLVAALIFVAILLVIRSDLISFRDMAKRM